MVEQVKADKDLIEKHNEVLITLSETAQQIATAQAKLRAACYWAIGLAGLSVLSVILLWVMK